MARKYEVSIVNKFNERMTVTGFDSFDEAYRELEKAVEVRERLIEERNKESRPVSIRKEIKAAQVTQ